MCITFHNIPKKDEIFFLYITSRCNIHHLCKKEFTFAIAWSPPRQSARSSGDVSAVNSLAVAQTRAVNIDNPRCIIVYIL